MHGKLIASGRANIDDARGIVVDRVRRTSQTNAARAATMREIWMARIRKLTGLAIAAAIVPFAMMTGGLFAQDASSSSMAAAPSPMVGDAAAGAAVFKTCAACHNIGPGAKNKIGPSLTGVVGRQPGTFVAFNYSTAIKDFGTKNPAWTPELLAQFLQAPGKFIPGTKMTFAGLHQQADVDNVIAYLASQSGP
jgi:cytochrome c